MKTKDVFNKYSQERLIKVDKILRFDGYTPPYEYCKPGVLLVPNLPNYPAVDAIYVQDHNNLVVFQISVVPWNEQKPDTDYWCGSVTGQTSPKVLRNTNLMELLFKNILKKVVTVRRKPSGLEIIPTTNKEIVYVHLSPKFSSRPEEDWKQFSEVQVCSEESVKTLLGEAVISQLQ